MDLTNLINVLAQGINMALIQVLPSVDAATRNTAAHHVADTVLRLYQSGGFDAVAKEPVVVAPVLDLKKELTVTPKVKL